MAAQAGFEPALPKHGLTVRCITYLPLSIEMVRLERIERSSSGWKPDIIAVIRQTHKMVAEVGIEPTQEAYETPLAT